MALGWREDIVGLRAISVVAVLFFHLLPDAFGFGYLGVDVFFVISGFVITNLLINLQEKHGTILLYHHFFKKRILRLFPSFFVVLFFSGLIAFLFLPSIYLREASYEFISAALSVSNFYFLFSTDYFNDDSIGKILLHTWSLSVEEQFYLIWPFFILLLHRLGTFYLILGILPFLGISLGAFFAGIEGNGFLVEVCGKDCADSWSFFNSLARFWQLLVGCLISVFASRFNFTVNTFFKEKSTSALTCGYLMLVCFLLFGEGWGVDAWAAQIGVVFLTASLLALGLCKDGLLSYPIIQYLGKTSYCLYLVHWPIIVVTSVFFPEGMSWFAIVFCCAASLVCSHALHVLVEVRFRW